MGSGYRVFTAGEVLSASNVQNYLQDQAVMVFGGTAARSSAIGTANFEEGMLTYLTDVDKLQVYTGAAFADVYPPTASSQGLTLISTTSFSGVTSVSLPAATFSATYLNYRLLLNLDITVNSSEISMRMRASGTDNTSSNYVWGRYGVNSANTFNGTGSGGALETAWKSVPVSGLYPAFQSIDILSPFSTDFHAGFNAQGVYVDAVASNWMAGGAGGVLSVNTSYDSFTFSGPTMTGRYSVYGYNI